MNRAHRKYKTGVQSNCIQPKYQTTEQIEQWTCLHYLYFFYQVIILNCWTPCSLFYLFMCLHFYTWAYFTLEDAEVNQLLQCYRYSVSLVWSTQRRSFGWSPVRVKRLFWGNCDRFIWKLSSERTTAWYWLCC